MISQSYNKKDRIVNLPPPLQAIGDDDESDQFLVQWLGDNKESQYTCTGISLISQWEVNGKSTGSQRDGEDQLSFILAWSMHENLTRVPFSTYSKYTRDPLPGLYHGKSADRWKNLDPIFTDLEMLNNLVAPGRIHHGKM